MKQDDDSAPLTRDIAPFGLRMPPDLKARVKLSAEDAGRSLNAQIVHDLEYLYPPPSPIDDLQDRLDKVIEVLINANSEMDYEKAVDELVDIKSKIRATVSQATMSQLIADIETES